jgi:putative hydrolases of HD superfamily
MPKKKSTSANRNLELLYEVGAFRWVRRTWEQFFSGDAASNAEHSFRVAWTALLIANMERKVGQKIDQEKLLKMAMLHDLPESRTGDVNYLSRQYTKRNENLAAADILANTALEKEFLELWQEFEQRKSIEAKIVKDADILDVDLELSEMKAEGRILPDRFKPHRSLNKSILFTKSAKKLWDQIQKGNPYDWHLRGRNRFNAGDWTKHRKKT